MPIWYRGDVVIPGPFLKTAIMRAIKGQLCLVLSQQGAYLVSYV